MSKWVRAEIMIIRQCAGTMTVENIGRLIGRTDAAVRAKARELHIKLYLKGDHHQSAKYRQADVALARELHCAESAALVSDLASQLEVQFARSNALAAENAHMQQVIGEVQILYYESDGVVGYHLNGEVAKWDDVMPDLWAETPATDAFLAEVRASCVDAVKQKISDAISGCYQDEMAGLDAAVNIANEFAANLRKGVQS